MTKVSKAKASKTSTVKAVKSDYLKAMLKAFAERSKYEADKKADNDSMQAHLTDLIKSVDHDAIAQVLCAANVKADFINRSERSSSRFNIYAAQKIVNVARSIKSVAVLNHYTKAIAASAKAFQDAKVDFTQRDAIAACSIDSKRDSVRNALLKRYEKIVSPSTASTQASSSLNALLQFSVLKEYRNAANETCFAVNTNEASEKILAA